MSAVYEQVEQFGSALIVPPRSRALTAGAVILTLLFVTQILQLVPSLQSLHLAKIAVIAVSAVFLISAQGFASRLRLKAVPQLECALGLLAIALITAPFSSWPTASLQFTAEVLAKNVVFLYLLIQASRTDRDRRLIAAALVFGCTLLAIALTGALGPVVAETQSPARLSIGDTYDSNDLALLFVIAIPFAFFLLKPSGPVMRALLIFAIALLLSGMVLTGSRGGFLGLLAIGVLILFRSPKAVRKYAVLTIVAGILLLSWAAPAEYWNRIGTIYNYETDYNLSDSGGRLAIWRNGLQMLGDSPLFGVGIGTFSLVHAQLSPSKLEIAPHNTSLQVAAELGVVGLALFLYIIFVSIRDARRIRREITGKSSQVDDGLLWLASAVEVSLVGFLVSSFFLSHAYSAILCFLVGMGAAVTAARRVHRKKDTEEIEYT